MKDLECRRISAGSSYTEYARLVFPRHANPMGYLYGGHMLHWIIDSGTISLARVLAGEAVLGYIDNVYFLNPVMVGDLLIYRSWVARAGKSSVGIYTEILSAGPRKEGARIVGVAKAIYVSVDGAGRPVPHRICVEASEPWESSLLEYMNRWHESALRAVELFEKSLKDSRERILRIQARSVRRVSAEDGMGGSIMYAGRLMLFLDEVAAIVAHNYARSNVVTASVDQMIFSKPIRVGDFIEIGAALTRTWRSSMEIEVSVRSYTSGEVKTRSFFTFVKLGEDGRPAPLDPYEPATPEEMEAWEEAEARRRSRMEDLSRMARYKEALIDVEKLPRKPLTLP